MFHLLGQQSLGGRCPLHILGQLRPSLCLPTSSNNLPNPPKDQVFPRHRGDPHRFSTPASTMAPSTPATQPSSSHTVDRRSPLPVHSQPSPPSVPQRPSPVGSYWLLSGIFPQTAPLPRYRRGNGSRSPQRTIQSCIKLTVEGLCQVGKWKGNTVQGPLIRHHGGISGSSLSGE